MNNDQYTKVLGSRILSEANDLKRTAEALAKDIGFSPEKVHGVIKGEQPIEVALEIIKKMDEIYPIDGYEVTLPKNDCDMGIRYFSSEDSVKSERIFQRKNAKGGMSDYYSYRDTAMSKVAPFRPEWIKELRVVSDSDPENPDVVYNNGHFMHQFTFFVGPVNFYYEVDGKKYCKEMNTGDSNYITPFWRHSFASRDESQEAYIVAVTFGADVKKAQKEIAHLGERASQFALGYKRNSGMQDLINFHLENQSLSLKNFIEVLPKEIKISEILEGRPANSHEVKSIAKTLRIEESELLLSEFRPEDEVVVKFDRDLEPFVYCVEEKPVYEIKHLAMAEKMSRMRSLSLKTRSRTPLYWRNGLHNYVYNFGEKTLRFHWKMNGEERTLSLMPRDSVYIQPFVDHAFTGTEEEHGEVCVARVCGAFNLSTQKEFSYFSRLDRVISETTQWF